METFGSPFYDVIVFLEVKNMLEWILNGGAVPEKVSRYERINTLNILATSFASYATDSGGVFLAVGTVSKNIGLYRWNGAVYASYQTLVGDSPHLGGRMDMSSDASTVVAVDVSNSRINVFRNDSGTYSRVFVVKVATVNAFGRTLTVSANGHIIVVGGDGRGKTAFVYIWNGTTYTLGQTITSTITNFGLVVKLSGDGNTLIVGSSGPGVAHVYKNTNGTFTIDQVINNPNFTTVSTIDLTYDGGVLVFGSGVDKRVSLYTVVNGAYVEKAALISDAVNFGYNINIAEAGARLAVSVNANLLEIYSITAEGDLLPVQQIEPYGRQIATPLLTNDASVLLCGDFLDKKVHRLIWQG